MRNRRIEAGLPDELRDQSIPGCRNFWEVQRPEGATSGNFYIDVDAIGETTEQLKSDFSPLVKAKKVRITAGEKRVAALQIYTFREIADLGELDPENDVIIGGVSGDLEDGGDVVLVRERWALRPGDVVRVGLKRNEVLLI